MQQHPGVMPGFFRVKNLKRLMKKILKNIYTQRGYAKKVGLTDARISQMISEGKLKLVETMDGKTLIEIL